jgi:hypothetical protein
METVHGFWDSVVRVISIGGLTVSSLIRYTVDNYSLCFFVQYEYVKSYEVPVK